MRKKIIIWPKMEHLKPKWEKVNEDVKKGSCVATLCPISSLLLTDDNTKKRTSTFVKTSMRSASSFSFLFQWQILLLLLLPTCLWLYVWLTDLLTSLPVHFRSVDGHLFIIIITCFTTFSQLRWEKKKQLLSASVPRVLALKNLFICLVMKRNVNSCSPIVVAVAAAHLNFITINSTLIFETRLQRLLEPLSKLDAVCFFVSLNLLFCLSYSFTRPLHCVYVTHSVTSWRASWKPLFAGSSP